MEQNQRTATIYTDGSCLLHKGNQGGWAFLAIKDGTCWQGSGGKENTNSDEMELEAVIRALESLGKDRHIVTIFSDSQYICSSFPEPRLIERIEGGQSKRVQKDAWVTLLHLCAKHSVRFVWIKGHAENQWNILVDALARTAAEKVRLDTANSKVKGRGSSWSKRDPKVIDYRRRKSRLKRDAYLEYA